MYFIDTWQKRDKYFLKESEQTTFWLQKKLGQTKFYTVIKKQPLNKEITSNPIWTLFPPYFEIKSYKSFELSLR